MHNTEVEQGMAESLDSVKRITFSITEDKMFRISISEKFTHPSLDKIPANELFVDLPKNQIFMLQELLPEVAKQINLIEALEDETRIPAARLFNE
jgi:hypothetical protein